MTRKLPANLLAGLRVLNEFAADELGKPKRRRRRRKRATPQVDHAELAAMYRRVEAKHRAAGKDRAANFAARVAKLHEDTSE